MLTRLPLDRALGASVGAVDARDRRSCPRHRHGVRRLSPGRRQVRHHPQGAAVRADDDRRRRRRHLPDRQQGRRGEGCAGRHQAGRGRAALAQGRLPRPALPDVHGGQAAQDQGRPGARAAHRQPARERPVRPLPEDPEGPFRARVHDRHAAHDDHEHGRPLSGRGLHAAPAAASTTPSCTPARRRCRASPMPRRRSGSSRRCWAW